jgi:hypothetical protein
MLRWALFTFAVVSMLAGAAISAFAADLGMPLLPI